MLEIGKCYKLSPEIMFMFWGGSNEVEIRYKHKTEEGLEENTIFTVIDESQELQGDDVKIVKKIIIDNKLVWFYYMGKSKLCENLDKFILEVL